jgi:hypothetical protein
MDVDMGFSPGVLRLRRLMVTPGGRHEGRPHIHGTPYPVLALRPVATKTPVTGEPRRDPAFFMFPL